MMLLASFFAILQISFSSTIQSIQKIYPNVSELAETLKENSEKSIIDLLSGDLEESLFQTEIVENLEFRTAVRDPRLLWEDGVVPYKLSEKFGIDEQHRFLDVIAEFSEKTCIFFVPHTDENRYLFLKPGNGCDTIIGKDPDGKRTISKLAKECFFVKPGILLHEMMHVLGFVHEHNRPDRDKYIKVLENNIIEEKLLQFEKYSWNEVKVFNFSYDYGSVMHYGPYVFSKNGKPTIIPLKEGVRIGQREGFSPTDVIKINKLYC